MQKKDIKQLTKAELEAMFLNHNSKIPPLVPIISIHNKIYAVKGGISMLTGITGSGKSTIMRLILSQALKTAKTEQSYEDLGIEVVPAEGRPVFYFNTEMPDSLAFSRIHDAVLKDLGLNKTPENFKFWSMLDLKYDQRKDAIPRILELYPETHLLVLDGGADTVNSVNDEVKSVDAIEELNALANKYQTTILNVVHENKGNRQSRGHYGQHNERKASGVISVEYDKKAKVFSIRAEKMRVSGEFEPIYFHYNDRDQIEQVSAKSGAQNQGKAKEDELLELVLDCFKVKDRWVRSELTSYIADSKGVHVRNAQVRVTKMFERNLITTDGAKHVKCLVAIDRIQQRELV